MKVKEVMLDTDGLKMPMKPGAGMPPVAEHRYFASETTSIRHDIETGSIAITRDGVTRDVPMHRCKYIDYDRSQPKK